MSASRDNRRSGFSVPRVTSPLERLSGPNKPLEAEPADPKEFAALRDSGITRLKDSQVAQLSLESRFDLAYNAAHALCLAALRWHGYRSSNRYIVFQVLPHTLGLGPEVWRVLAKAHDQRNSSEYIGKFDVDEKLLADVIVATGKVAAKLSAMKAPK
jgi:hypothetical protein